MVTGLKITRRPGGPGYHFVRFEQPKYRTVRFEIPGAMRSPAIDAALRRSMRQTIECGVEQSGSSPPS